MSSKRLFYHFDVIDLLLNVKKQVEIDLNCFESRAYVTSNASEFLCSTLNSKPKAGTVHKMQTVRFFNVTLLGIYR